jgi:DNA-binding NarL/FixJ family response regulator
MKPKRKLLVVNCIEERGEVLAKEALRTERVEVIGQTDDGNVAIQMVEKMKPNILISCIGLRGMSGLELTKQISSRFPDIKVIITSIRNMENEAMELGAFAYILLPASRDEIYSAFSSAISQMDSMEGI